jgi:ribosomal protein S27E
MILFIPNTIDKEEYSYAKWIQYSHLFGGLQIIKDEKEKKNTVQKTCPECDNDSIFEYDYKRDETVCRSCGLVLAGPPAYCAGRRKIDYPWQYNFNPEAYDQNNRPGYIYFPEYMSFIQY